MLIESRYHVGKEKEHLEIDPGLKIALGKDTWTTGQTFRDLLQNHIDAELTVMSREVLSMFFSEERLREMNEDEQRKANEFVMLAYWYALACKGNRNSEESVDGKGLVSLLQELGAEKFYYKKSGDILSAIRDKCQIAPPKIFVRTKDGWKENNYQAYSKEVEQIAITDGGFGYNHKASGYFKSNKADNPLLIGTHGEGLKLSQASLVRNGARVRFISEQGKGNEKKRWLMKTRKEKGNVKLLGHSISSPAEELPFSSATIVDLRKADPYFRGEFNNASSSSLNPKFLHQQSLEYSDSKFEYPYFSANIEDLNRAVGVDVKGDGNSIYVQGLRVDDKDSSKMLFDYNFLDKTILFGRDRNHLKKDRLINDITYFWSRVKDAKLAQQFITRILTSKLDSLEAEILEKCLPNLEASPVLTGAVRSWFVNKQVTGRKLVVVGYEQAKLPDVAETITELGEKYNFVEVPDRFTTVDNVFFINDATEYDPLLFNFEELGYHLTREARQPKQQKSELLETFAKQFREVVFESKTELDMLGVPEVEKIKILFAYGGPDQEGFNVIASIKDGAPEIKLIAYTDKPLTSEQLEKMKTDFKIKLLSLCAPEFDPVNTKKSAQLGTMRILNRRKLNIEDVLGLSKLSSEAREYEKKPPTVVNEQLAQDEAILSEMRTRLNGDASREEIEKLMEDAKTRLTYSNSMERVATDVAKNWLYVSREFPGGHNERLNRLYNKAGMGEMLFVSRLEAKLKFRSGDAFGGPKFAGLEISEHLLNKSKNRGWNGEIIWRGSSAYIETRLRPGDIITHRGINYLYTKEGVVPVDEKGFADTYKNSLVATDNGIFIDVVPMIEKPKPFEQFGIEISREESDRPEEWNLNTQSRIETSLDMSYAEGRWNDPSRVLLDLAQNEMDATDERSFNLLFRIGVNENFRWVSADEVEAEDTISGIEFSDDGKGFLPDTLKDMGASSKKSILKTGRHGEALKLISAMSLRTGLEFSIDSCLETRAGKKRWEATPAIAKEEHESEDAFGVKTKTDNRLVFNIKEKEPTKTGSKFKLVAGSNSALSSKLWGSFVEKLDPRNKNEFGERGLGRYLRPGSILGEPQGERVSQKIGPITFYESGDVSMGGELYENGVSLGSMQELLLTYDVPRVSGSRERDSVDPERLGTYLRFVFMKNPTSELVKAFLSALKTRGSGDLNQDADKFLEFKALKSLKDRNMTGSGPRSLWLKETEATFGKYLFCPDALEGKLGVEERKAAVSAKHNNTSQLQAVSMENYVMLRNFFPTVLDIWKKDKNPIEVKLSEEDEDILRELIVKRSEIIQKKLGNSIKTKNVEALGRKEDGALELKITESGQFFVGQITHELNGKMELVASLLSENNWSKLVATIDHELVHFLYDLDDYTPEFVFALARLAKE